MYTIEYAVEVVKKDIPALPSTAKKVIQKAPRKRGRPVRFLKWQMSRPRSLKNIGLAY